MKKIFTFLFAALMSVSMFGATVTEEPGGEAAEIVFTQAVAADDLADTATFAAEGSLFSATIYDSGNKMAIDENSCRFGTAEDYKSYTHRLKSGGASSSTKNYIMLNIPEDGVIRIAPRTGSNGATDRALVITQDDDTLYNAIVQESQAIEVTEGEQQVKVYPYVEVAVAAGSVRVSYTAGMNFYGFGFAKESVDPVVPTAPATAPAVPDHAEEDVMALYCSHYATNNLHFNVLGWGGIQTWQELTLGDDSTKVLACTDMTWEMMTNWDKASYDFSGYEKFHFDVWVPFNCHLKVTFEALKAEEGGSGWKHGIDFALNEGWNTVDCDPVWWNTDSVTYDWTDVKYIAFEGYKMEDGETSAEGNPLAFTNLYWWKAAAPKNIPAEAPATPTRAEKDIQALFSSAYKTNTFNFAPTSWSTQWIDHEYQGGVHIWYADAMAWDGFTNWDTTRYDLNAFDMMHADVYVTLDSKLKFTFEALSAGDGGSGWKNGASVDLVGNQWNSLDIDLLNAPFDSYDFKDLRYLILEGFVKPDGSSAEGTPLAIANVYFWNSMTPVENVANDKVAVKRIVNGQLMIQVNGQEYNVLGTQF